MIMPLYETIFSGFHILLLTTFGMGLSLPFKEQIRNITRLFLVRKAESLVTVHLQYTQKD